MEMGEKVPTTYPGATAPYYYPQTTCSAPPQPPPQYGAPGSLPYGFISPPPPYPGDLPPGYYQGYPTPTHGTLSTMPPGGQALYPDVSQLPQPPSGNAFLAFALHTEHPYCERTSQVTPHGTPVHIQGTHQPLPSAPLKSPSLETSPFSILSNLPTQSSTINGHPQHASSPPPDYLDSASSRAELHPMPTKPSVPGLTNGGGVAPHLAPARPAPPVPPPPTAAPLAPSSLSQSPVNWKEGEAPPGYVVQWRGGEGLQVFFIQQEGHVVSPKKCLIMSVYKKICCGGSSEGIVEVHGCWKLQLTDGVTPALHTTNGYVFLDDSTCPNRVVVVQMPIDLSRRMSSDLHELLNDLTNLREEEEGVVHKLTTGVSTVYSDLTHKLNTAVKDAAPGAHKNTKWIRKSTGSLVKIGGNLVAKGIHLVADNIPAQEKTQEDSPAHTELLEALYKYRKCFEDGSITYVD